MERLELRPCVQPVWLHPRVLYEIDGLDGQFQTDNYGGSFTVKDGQWYQVWHYAFHTTVGRLSCKVSNWCWKTKYH